MREKEQEQDQSEVDWKTFKIILCGAPVLFLFVAILTDSWSTVIGLLVFAPVLTALVVLRNGRRRAVTLHVAMAMLVTYQILLLRATVDEPNIGLVWFLGVPVTVGLLGNRQHVLIWTPVALIAIAYCWTLYASHPTMAHPLALPNLLAATCVIAAAAFGMIVQRDRRERALKTALLSARREAWEREIAQTESSESRAAITRFLGSVSHELRTPLTSIVLSADVLDRTTDDPTHRTWIENIRVSAKSLVLLLNDVLDLAHSDAGRSALRHETFAIEDLLGAVRAIVEPMAFECDIEWFVGAMPDVPVNYVGDVARLRQVLVNLLSNALRHSRATRVWLTVSTRESRLCLAVGDNGCGIPADDQREVFKPFRQLGPSAADDERKGTGLGLTISAGYVEAMGGQIALRSVLHKGTVFDVLLPLEEAAPSPLASAYPAASDWPHRVELRDGCPRRRAWASAWLAQWKIELAQGALPLSLSDQESPVDSIDDLRACLNSATGASDVTEAVINEPRKAFDRAQATANVCAICDDDPAILSVLCQLLEQAGYGVVSFRAPDALLEYVASTSVNTIILDVNLGAESGLDVLRELRALRLAANTPVCMLSGSMDNRDAALAAGADDYLLKPASLTQILATVSRLSEARSKLVAHAENEH